MRTFISMIYSTETIHNYIVFCFKNWNKETLLFKKKEELLGFIDFYSLSNML